MANESNSAVQRRLERVANLCRGWAEEHAQRAVVVFVAQAGQLLMQQGFGTARSLSDDKAAPFATQPDTIFLVASLTKPLTALAVCMLVEDGRLDLDDQVSTFIPAFSGGQREAVRVRHLLTHTSGLPDMLPENTELRQAHAPLSVFVERTCATPMLFAPGTDCRYQSMGTLLAGAIVERMCGIPLPEFLQRRLFTPLGMKDTCLGLGLLDRSRMACLILPPADDVQDWTWNSLYWRGLASPWGGLHTTAAEYARVLHMALNGGVYDGRRILGVEMAKAMLTNQLLAMPGLAEQAKTEQAWGLGWRLNQPPGTHTLPETGSAGAFGHAGATGTVAWADPASGTVCVILTNDPASSPLRARLSNVIAAIKP
jgi:CubicO group peptidase (beta-lactamase class C family)